MHQVALVIILVSGTVLARCPLGSVQGIGQGDCFKLHPYADTWYGAEDDCRSKGGHLTSVSSAFTNALLRDQFALRSATSFWLGGSEGSSYASWTWSDGTRFSYTNWARGEPSNNTTLCLAASTQSGLWLSEPCYESKPYICKLPALQDGNRSSFATPVPQKTTCAPDRPSSKNVTCPRITCPPPPPTASRSCQPGTEPTWATPPATPRCDFGWTYSPVTKDCWTTNLENSDERYIWPTEVGVCASHNTSAISIHSPEANHAAAVFAQANNDVNNHYYVAVWLGLHAPNARWQWADNSTYNYANWAPGGETNCDDIGSDCYVAMSIVNDTSFGKWTGYSRNGYGPDDIFGETIICVKPAYY